MKLSDLTSKDAVLSAIGEYDRLGADIFRRQYGFGPARSYFLVHDNRRYDSKAIVGAAYGYQYPDRGPLTAHDFSGGEATVQRLLENLGFVVENDASQTSSQVAANAPSRLTHYETYERKHVHDLFAPGTPFQASRGSWGSHGIVALPHRPQDFVFFVTYGRTQGEHTFEEGVSETGILTWQSQPAQKLTDPQIQQFIHHNDLEHTIHLFLRTHRDHPYTYIGTLSYIAHDSEREQPVHFQWQITPWPVPAEILARMNLTLQPDAVEEDVTLVVSPVDTQTPRGGLQQLPLPPVRVACGISTRTFRGRKRVDFAGIDARNKKLGSEGEVLVLKHERQILEAAGRLDLAAQVQHVAALEGDGAGYDVLSFTPEGAIKYIEVKTTCGNAHTPFYMSSNEVAFAKQHRANYYLYRLYEVEPERDTGRFYVVSGELDTMFAFEATEYRVSRVFPLS